MGEFAEDVQERLQQSLETHSPNLDWETEYMIGGTPVDIAGVEKERVVVIELEWRRADPADNTAKLFRHIVEKNIDVEQLTVFQLFTRFYNLVRGGVSTKRQNAEFIGETAAEAFPHLTYNPVTFGIEPPKRGEERPQNWKESTDQMASTLSHQIP